MKVGARRLLYLGDVPVEPSYHGSALLYRLLQTVPPEALVIVEGNLYPTATAHRLPGVTHLRLRVGTRRLMNSRLHTPYTRWLVTRAPSRARAVLSMLGQFAPEAVVTVAHGFSWITAARLARLRGIPLHLIVHDDCPRVVPIGLQPVVDGHFRVAYQQAASRLCVSPSMAEEYRRRYGVDGTVLLPSRSADAPVFDGPAPRVSQPQGPPVFAFAGTINTPGYARLLRQLADQLRPYQGRLLIFGPLTRDQADASGLAHDAIELCGLLESGALIARLRASVDVLFVPMSFAAADESNMRMSFPSKLTDYTAVGVPLLLCGPPYCSAVRWANENHGVAEVVMSDQPQALAEGVDRLVGDRAHRLALARQAQLIGARDFAAAAAAATFHHALNQVQ